MGLFGGNQDAQERYYNLPVSTVYNGMKGMLEKSRRFALKHADDLSCTCTFNTGISMTTWGEKMTAVVSPQRRRSESQRHCGGEDWWQHRMAGFQECEEPHDLL